MGERESRRADGRVVSEEVVHACPRCGYWVSDLQFVALRFDMSCPRCGKTRASEFEMKTRRVYVDRTK